MTAIMMNCPRCAQFSVVARSTEAAPAAAAAAASPAAPTGLAALRAGGGPRASGGAGGGRPFVDLSLTRGQQPTELLCTNPGCDWKREDTGMSLRPAGHPHRDAFAEDEVKSEGGGNSNSNSNSNSGDAGRDKSNITLLGLRRFGLCPDLQASERTDDAVQRAMGFPRGVLCNGDGCKGPSERAFQAPQLRAVVLDRYASLGVPDLTEKLAQRSSWWGFKSQAFTKKLKSDPPRNNMLEWFFVVSGAGVAAADAESLDICLSCGLPVRARYFVPRSVTSPPRANRTGQLDDDWAEKQVKREMEDQAKYGAKFKVRPEVQVGSFNGLATKSHIPVPGTGEELDPAEAAGTFRPQPNPINIGGGGDAPVGSDASAGPSALERARAEARRKSMRRRDGRGHRIGDGGGDGDGDGGGEEEEDVDEDTDDNDGDANADNNRRNNQPVDRDSQPHADNDDGGGDHFVNGQTNEHGGMPLGHDDTVGARYIARDDAAATANPDVTGAAVARTAIVVDNTEVAAAKTAAFVRLAHVSVLRDAREHITPLMDSLLGDPSSWPGNREAVNATPHYRELWRLGFFITALASASPVRPSGAMIEFGLCRDFLVSQIFKTPQAISALDTLLPRDPRDPDVLMWSDRGVGVHTRAGGLIFARRLHEHVELEVDTVLLASLRDAIAAANHISHRASANANTAAAGPAPTSAGPATAPAAGALTTDAASQQQLDTSVVRTLRVVRYPVAWVTPTGWRQMQLKTFGFATEIAEQAFTDAVRGHKKTVYLVSTALMESFIGSSTVLTADSFFSLICGLPSVTLTTAAAAAGAGEQWILLDLRPDYMTCRAPSSGVFVCAFDRLKDLRCGADPDKVKVRNENLSTNFGGGEWPARRASAALQQQLLSKLPQPNDIQVLKAFGRKEQIDVLKKL